MGFINGIREIANTLQLTSPQFRSTISKCSSQTCFLLLSKIENESFSRLISVEHCRVKVYTKLRVYRKSGHAKRPIK